MWSRIHLIPLLQAEEDRDLARRHMADQAREKQLTGDNFKVYNSDRFVPSYFLFFFRGYFGKGGPFWILTLLVVLQICAPDVCCHPRQHHEIEYTNYLLRCGVAGKPVASLGRKRSRSSSMGTKRSLYIYQDEKTNTKLFLFLRSTMTACVNVPAERCLAQLLDCLTAASSKVGDLPCLYFKLLQFQL